MITLYQPKGHFGLPNLSPFCMKLETWLRMSQIPFETKPANIRKAPNGKLPYIKDGQDYIGDTSLIIDHLRQKYPSALDQHLSASEQAISLAMQRLFENHLNFAMIYNRWIEAENWPKMRALFLGDLPPVLKQTLPPLIQKKVLRDIKGHGLGKHPAETIYKMALDDLQAIRDFLADKPYFMGEQPTSLDAVAYAFLANILWVPLTNPLQDFIQDSPNLVAYCERMKAAFYGV